MFLFPWLDWGIDISDFGKIDFLTHKPFLAFSAPWKSAIFDPQVKFRADYGVVEYSDGPNFFKKPNISAFERRVWNLYTTPRYEEPGISLKKSEKKQPECGFDMRVSNSWFSLINRQKSIGMALDFHIPTIDQRALPIRISYWVNTS